MSEEMVHVYFEETILRRADIPYDELRELAGDATWIPSPGMLSTGETVPVIPRLTEELEEALEDLGVEVDGTVPRITDIRRVNQ